MPAGKSSRGHLHRLFPVGDRGSRVNQKVSERAPSPRGPPRLLRRGALWTYEASCCALGSAPGWTRKLWISARSARLSATTRTSTSVSSGPIHCPPMNRSILSIRVTISYPHKRIPTREARCYFALHGSLRSTGPHRSEKALLMLLSSWKSAVVSERCLHRRQDMCRLRSSQLPGGLAFDPAYLMMGGSGLSFVMGRKSYHLAPEIQRTRRRADWTFHFGDAGCLHCLW